MSDFIARRYIVTVLEMVDQYLAVTPNYEPGDLQRCTPLIEAIASTLHDTFSAEVQ